MGLVGQDYNGDGRSSKDRKKPKLKDKKLWKKDYDILAGLCESRSGVFVHWEGRLDHVHVQSVEETKWREAKVSAHNKVVEDD